ncbi:YlzJ-like family protein [Priestia koreensis]|uniref:YlzJ-like family protein n=1 Tax=Priestia koreensis TaxID=284581 RepID=UPI001F567AC8|nr:YlzJ-like family protein [Priestia koreensis]MCM3003714.1 YlzJ-like family protein [Priestia koreensis]UNL83828.1 YlzJ-like family protein [Priestia koreensis]
MILYTMMPQELIFPTESVTEAQQKVVEYNGIPFVVMQNENGQHQIVRMLSTNPQDYLDSRYQPGETVM